MGNVHTKFWFLYVFVFWVRNPPQNGQTDRQTDLARPAVWLIRTFAWELAGQRSGAFELWWDL